jgi:UDP-galactopyranose mutase
MKKVLIIGAGFAGAVLGRELAGKGYLIDIIDERNHIAGNCYDCKDINGVFYHKYGPHYFRTNSDKIFNYVNRFSDFQMVDVNYEIKVFKNNHYYSFPINLNTFKELYGFDKSQDDFIAYLNKHKKDLKEIRNFEDFCISNIGIELYDFFYKEYTIKQWNKLPIDLPASIAARIPIRTNLNNKYFDEKYQCIPKNGYTNLIGNILSRPNINVKLNTSFSKDLIPHYDLVFYSGPIDRFFNYELGVLPYRSLDFQLINIQNTDFARPYLQTNYPELKYSFTREVEVKHITQQKTPHTNIVREFPADFIVGKSTPYYPINSPEAKELYSKYVEHGKIKEPKVKFIGRLGKFQYYNMDQIIGSSLTESEKYGN